MIRIRPDDADELVELANHIVYMVQQRLARDRLFRVASQAMTSQEYDEFEELLHEDVLARLNAPNAKPPFLPPPAPVAQ